MILGMFGIQNVYGENAISQINSSSSNLQVTIGRVSGKAGQEAVVPITFYNVPKSGINNCNFALEYDTNALEFKSMEAGSIVSLPIANFAYHRRDNIINTVFSDESLGSLQIVSDGAFAYIKFIIKKDISGGVYDIKLSGKATFSCLNGMGLKSIPFVFTDGYVIAQKVDTSVPDRKYSVNIELGKVNGKAGSEITVPVKFDNIPPMGINNCDFIIGYDTEGLEFKSVEPGDIVTFPLGCFNYHKSQDGRINFLYNDETQGAMPIVKNGVFAKITFKIVDNAKAGIYGVSKFSVGFFSGFINGKLSNITPIFSEGYINIEQAATSIPTNTPTNTPTITPTSTPTITSTSTPTSTPTNTPTSTPTITPTVTPTPTNTPVSIPSSPQYDMNVDIGKVVGATSEEVVVPITFDKIPSIGINNCDFILGYDSTALEFKRIEAGSIVTDPLRNFSYSNPFDGQINLLFVDESISNMPIVKSGVFAIVVFKVKDNTPSGTYYVNKQRVGSFSGVLDRLLAPINAKFYDGYVKIRK